MISLDNEIKSSIFEQVEREGYSKKLGLKLIELDEGHAVVEMTPAKEDTNIFGMIHGGAIFSLMDEAFQVSCNSYGVMAVALSVNVIFHNPPKQGSKLLAESNEIHRSHKTATYDIRVTDNNDILIASCQALAYRRKERLPFLNEKAE